nr:circumsporozoite protein-like [Aegilops tauschii subsp. strangulata]
MVEATRRYSSLEYRRLGRWTPALARVTGRDGNAETSGEAGGETTGDAAGMAADEVVDKAAGEAAGVAAGNAARKEAAAKPAALEAGAGSEEGAPVEASGPAEGAGSAEEAEEAGTNVGARGATRPTVRGPPKLGGGPRAERGRPPDGVAEGPVATGRRGVPAAEMETPSHQSKRVGR